MKNVIYFLVSMLILSGTSCHTVKAKKDSEKTGEVAEIKLNCPAYSERGKNVVIWFLTTDHENMVEIKKSLNMPLIDTNSVRPLNDIADLMVCTHLNKEMGFKLTEYDEYSFFRAGDYYFIIKVLKYPAVGLTTIVIFNKDLEELDRFSG